MPTVTPYAEIMGQENVSKALASVTDSEGMPLTGRRLGQIRVELTDGRVYLVPVAEKHHGMLRRLFELTQDSSCREIIDSGHVSVSLRHLDHLDDETRVRVGYRINTSSEESRLLRDDSIRDH